ncbi:hypothetical protein AB0D71_16800 [Streptomyces avermitilis]|uniref:hypothetical protein n=1 Tax=Streptomyces avermitilis TaxID=33903 RepID=UPI0033EDC722
MSEIPALVTAHWPPAPSSATDWLLELAGDGVTGFMPPPLPDAAWVLNAMYEQEQGPTDMSYDENNRARLTDGSIKPQIIAGIDLIGVGTATGGDLGRAEHPGPGWRRLRWAELARRTGDPLVPDGLLPSHRCFPSAKKEGSRPLGIRPPTEGSLDRETWNRLIEMLTEHSPAGADTRCLAYCNPLMLRDPACAYGSADSAPPGSCTTTPRSTSARPTSGLRTTPGSPVPTTTCGPPRWQAPHR